MQGVDYRATFDKVAQLYDQTRPGYPKEVVTEICRYAGLTETSAILEVGTGTGQMTRPFAELGCRILSLELGPSLARIATKNLAPYPNVRVENVALEAWTVQENAFDLVLSAQAFHWIEAPFGLGLAQKTLRPSGALALVWNLDDSAQTDFYEASTPLFDKYVPQDPARPLPPASHTLYKTQLANSFTEVQEREITWQHIYDKRAFLDLLATFSPHIALDVPTRQTFFAEMAKLIDTFGGEVLRHYRTVTLLAKTAA